MNSDIPVDWSSAEDSSLTTVEEIKNATRSTTTSTINASESATFGQKLVSTFINPTKGQINVDHSSHDKNDLGPSGDVHSDDYVRNMKASGHNGDKRDFKLGQKAANQVDVWTERSKERSKAL